MTKGTIKNSYWDPTAKVAVVVKQTKYGTFKAWSIPAEEDFDIATEWDGYKFAEYKCDIAIANERAKRMWERYLGIRTAYYNLCQGNDKADPILSKLERQMYLAKRDAKIARQECDSMRQHFKPFCDNVIADRKRLHEWKLKREAALSAENE